MQLLSVSVSDSFNFGKFLSDSTTAGVKLVASDKNDNSSNGWVEKSGNTLSVFLAEETAGRMTKISGTLSDYQSTVQSAIDAN